MVKKTKKISQRTHKPSALNIFKHLNLINIRLVDLIAKLSIVQSGGQMDDPRYDLTMTVGPSQEEGKILVDSILKLESPSGGAVEGKSSLLIICQFQCVYQAIDLEVEKLAEYADVLAQSAGLMVWPHCRETVQSITSKMGIKPVLLPLLLRDSLSNTKEEASKKAALGKSDK